MTWMMRSIFHWINYPPLRSIVLLEYSNNYKIVNKNHGRKLNPPVVLI